MVMFLLAVNADGNILFLYVREKFNWTLRHYTVFLSESSIAWVASSIIGGYFLNKLLRVQESVVIIFGCLSLMVAHMVQALATQEWQMYLGK